ncbi:MAG: hypothetical protein O2800_03390 [Planctomycetota bacterium]|nr:hypothetical protein [Planctomycetota bacterium]
MRIHDERVTVSCSGSESGRPSEEGHFGFAYRSFRLEQFMCVSRFASASALSVVVTSSSFGGILGTYSVGTGDFSSTVQIDFSNGNGYVFDVAWSGTTTGVALLESILLSVNGFAVTTDDFGWGAFVSGLGVGTDYEYGTGDQWPVVENYWHYWTDDGAGWASSWIGASDRIALDGSRDGWVFGIPAMPQSVPTPSVLVAFFAAGFTARRRR